MAVTWDSIDLGWKFSIILGVLLCISFLAGLVRLFCLRRRHRIEQKKSDAERALHPEISQKRHSRLGEGDLFGVRALEKGFFGGVSQTAPPSPTSSRHHSTIDSTPLGSPRIRAANSVVRTSSPLRKSTTSRPSPLNLAASLPNSRHPKTSLLTAPTTPTTPVSPVSAWRAAVQEHRYHYPSLPQRTHQPTGRGPFADDDSTASRRRSRSRSTMYSTSRNTRRSVSSHATTQLRQLLEQQQEGENPFEGGSGSESSSGQSGHSPSNSIDERSERARERRDAYEQAHASKVLYHHYSRSS